jgi:predicted esterase
MLQERDDWQEVLDESRRRHALAMKTSRVEVLVAHPSSRPRALLLVLHGAVDDATLTAPFWNPASAAEVSVAVLGSSQLASSDGARWWRDETRAEQDVAAVRAEMLADHPVPGDRTLLGGFSQGAVRAMSIVLRGEPFDSRGFIAVGPSIRDPETLSSHLDKAAERGVRAVVIAGADDYYAAGCKRWHERMSAAGIASDLAIVSGLGHEYPPDFAARLPGALDFALRPKRWPVIGEMTASEAIED